MSKQVDSSNSRELFPIRILAEKTRVGTSTLRAWERRYGLLKPQRTPKGHRLYSGQDAVRVQKIIHLVEDGHSLSDVAKLLALDLGAGAAPVAPGASTQAAKTLWDDYIASTVDAIRDFSVERIDAVYNEASSLYPLDMVTERLVQPVLDIVGQGWTEYAEKGVAEEHFYTSWLRHRLGARFHHAYTHAKGARIVCACLPGSYHEVGLMLFSLSALSRGYRVLYFGADLPLDQLDHIHRHAAARAIILSSNTPIPSTVSAELQKLIPLLKIPVFVGGNVDIQDEESTAFQSAGGILLGPNLTVALRVFESHVPAYPAAGGKR